MILRALPSALALAVCACGSSQGAKVEKPASEQASGPPATADVIRGERLLVNGRVQEAQRAFLQAIESDPDDARAWLDLGLTYEATQRFEKAESAYRRATEIDSSFAEAFNNLGVLLREKGELEEATRRLERAVAVDADLVEARFNLGLAYEDQGRYRDAEREYLVTIRQLPGDPVPRINLAMMYLEQGRDEDALGQLRAARASAENDVALSVAVGEGMRRASAPAEAVEVLGGALEQAGNPPPTELLAELALAHYAAGDLDAAERAMRRAISQNEVDPALQYAYGSILAKQGQLGKARAHFRRAVKLDPDGPYADRARQRLEALR